MSFVTEPMMIVSSQLDMIKDLLLVMRVITGLGWFYVVFTNPHLFSSNVSYFKLFALRISVVVIVLGMSVNFLSLSGPSEKIFEPS